MKKKWFLLTLLCLFSFSSNAWAKSFVVVKGITNFYTSSTQKTVFIQGLQSGYLTLKYVREEGTRVLVKLNSKQGCYSAAKTRGLELDLWPLKFRFQSLKIAILNAFLRRFF